MKSKHMNKDIQELSLRIGLEIGHQLAMRLPTLSCDLLQSRNVIQVKYGEAKELKRLDNEWHNNYDPNSKEKDPRWEALQKYHNELGAKYLPKEFKFMTAAIPECADLDKVKEGIGVSMWDCDYSWYGCKEEQIDIEDTHVGGRRYSSEITVYFKPD